MQIKFSQQVPVLNLKKKITFPLTPHLSLLFHLFMTFMSISCNLCHAGNIPQSVTATGEAVARGMQVGLGSSSILPGVKDPLTIQSTVLFSPTNYT